MGFRGGKIHAGGVGAFERPLEVRPDPLGASELGEEQVAGGLLGTHDRRESTAAAVGPDVVGVHDDRRVVGDEEVEAQRPQRLLDVLRRGVQHPVERFGQLQAESDRPAFDGIDQSAEPESHAAAHVDVGLSRGTGVAAGAEQATEHRHLMVRFGIAIFDRFEVVLAHERLSDQCIDHRFERGFDRGPSIRRREVRRRDGDRRHAGREVAQRFGEFAVGEPRDPASSEGAALHLDHGRDETLVDQQFDREGGDLRPEADVVSDHEIVGPSLGDSREQLHRGARVDLDARHDGLGEMEILGVRRVDREPRRQRESGHRRLGVLVSIVRKSEDHVLGDLHAIVGENSVERDAKCFAGCCERMSRHGRFDGGHRSVAFGRGRRGPGGSGGRILKAIALLSPEKPGVVFDHTVQDDRRGSGNDWRPPCRDVVPRVRSKTPHRASLRHPTNSDRVPFTTGLISLRIRSPCIAGRHETRSDSAGARTQDLAIKSRMLYQLSYGIPSPKV